MWALPYNSSMSFIEAFGGLDAKIMLMCRYVKFIQTVIKSSKLAAIFLLHRSIKNVNTVTGRNVNYILKQAGAEDIFKINIGQFKKKYNFVENIDDNQWKIDFVKEITNIKQNVLEVDQSQMTFKELDEIIEYLTTK